MGFDWLYLNPVHYPGFSGSLYAVKDYGRLHPRLVADGGDERLEALAPTVRAVRRAGLRVMMDLVINHTARDSPLVSEHPGWYRRGAAGEVISPRFPPRSRKRERSPSCSSWFRRRSPRRSPRR